MGDIPTNRPAPAASGTLAKTPILHLLVYALEKRLGGTIEFSAPDRRSASVLFVTGEPAKARGGEATTYLGRVLFDLGFLTEEQLSESLADLARAKTSSRALHGELLVRKGVLDLPRLETGLREQLARKLRYLATMPPETTYSYFDAFDGLHDWGAPTSFAVDPLSLLWDMLRENTPRAHVDAALTRVGASPLKLARAADLGRLKLGNVERTGAELLRARAMSAPEFALVSGLGDAQARLLAYLLLVTKQVDVLPSQSPQSIPPRAAMSSNPGPRISVAPPAKHDSSKPAGRRLSTMPPNSQIPAALAAVARSRPPPATLSPELAERWT